jgi:DNA-binding SARP family transcriptional activator
MGSQALAPGSARGTPCNASAAAAARKGHRVGSTAPANPRPHLRLHLRLLGELEVRRGDGPPLPLPPSRRTRALLGYLAATGTPQSRAALCDLLWDGPDDPRAALRWSLTKLRTVVNDVGDDAAQPLQADRDKVAFDTHACDIDSLRVSALVDNVDLDKLPLPTLEQAAHALQGEFLDGVELPACYRFHHWCMAERERFARLRRATLEALVRRLADDPQRALPHGRAMVAADPLADTAHATLVRLLAAAGRYPEAERHFAWARELLRREVSLPDGGPLDEAIRAVRRQQRQAAALPAADALAAADSDTAPDASHASATSATSATGATSATSATGATSATNATTAPRALSASRAGTNASPSPALAQSFADLLRPAAPARAPLVGRADECRAIEAALAASAQASLLLFIGEPGIGKTRLLDHFAERAQALGRRVIRARCFEAEAVRPYGFWLDALRGVPTAGVAARVLAQAAPLLARADSADGAPRVPGVEAAVNREQLFDAAAELLAGLAKQQPLAVLVDDLQWIDAASAALLHFVARRLADSGSPVQLAAAARVGETDDNAGAKGLLQSLARDRSLRQEHVHPLAEDDVRHWLGDHLADIREALRASGGNPLLLIEMAHAGGAGAPAGGRPLDELVADRLRSFDEASRDLLGWAAALGGEFSAERLAAATALPVTDVLTRLASFERRGLLHATEEGGFDFSHGLVRQAVYRALSTPRRRALHRQIARALDEASADDPWLHGAVVHHASLAGDARLGTRAALSAGQHWLRVFANAEAAQVADRGLALLAELPPNEERARLEIGLLRLRVAAAAAPGGARLPDLATRIAQAADTAQALGMHADASAAWELLAYCRQQAGDAAGARDASLAAERCTRRADDATRCRQLANTGRCLVDIEADPERGRTLLAEAEALADELQLTVMEIEWGRGLLARADGNLPAAREALARAVALARAAANHWREYECMLALATTEYDMGMTDEVLRHVDDITAAAQRMGEPQVPFADALAALVKLRRAEVEAAAAAASAAVHDSLGALRERDDKAHLAYVLNEAAILALAAGDNATATRHAEEALAAATAVRRPSQINRARAALADSASAAPSPDASAATLPAASGDASPAARSRRTARHPRSPREGETA